MQFALGAGRALLPFRSQEPAALKGKAAARRGQGYKPRVSNDLRSSVGSVVGAAADFGRFSRATVVQGRETRTPSKRPSTARELFEEVMEVGGRQEDRTPDLRIANAALSQLS